jgi:sensor histidine kinase regulating citrate/malate metabolism
MKNHPLKNKLIYVLLIIGQIIIFIIIINMHQHTINKFMSSSITYFLLLYPLTTLVLVYFILKCGHQRDINKKQNEFIADLRKQRHSFINHLETVSYFANNNQIDKLNTFLETVGNVTTILAKIDGIKNQHVASILNSSILKAEKKQIIFKLKSISDFLNFPLSPTHTIKVLGNLINNAIENCEKEKGFIYIETNEDENYFYFKITNNGNPIRLYKRGYSFEKWEERIQRWNRITGSDRGCGLLVVKEILEQYENSELIIEDNDPPTFILKLKIGG